MASETEEMAFNFIVMNQFRFVQLVSSRLVILISIKYKSK